MKSGGLGDRLGGGGRGGAVGGGRAAGPQRDEVGGGAGRGGVAAAVHRSQRRWGRFQGVEPSGSQREPSPRYGLSGSEQGPDATPSSSMNSERGVKQVAPF